MIKHFVLSYLILSCLVLSCLVLSCQNEISESENSVTKSPNNGTVINGRFYFSSKENLKKTIEEFKKESLSNLEIKFEKIYAKGFISNSPIVNIENQKLTLQLSERKDKKTKKIGSIVVESPQSPETPEGPVEPLEEIKESIIADWTK